VDTANCPLEIDLLDLEVVETQNEFDCRSVLLARATRVEKSTTVDAESASLLDTAGLTLRNTHLDGATQNKLHAASLIRTTVPCAQTSRKKTFGDLKNVAAEVPVVAAADVAVMSSEKLRE
jgi:hypothetical protein